MKIVDHTILPDNDEGGKMIMRHGLLARLTVGSHVQQTTKMTITMTMTMTTIRIGEFQWDGIAFPKWCLWDKLKEQMLRNDLEKWRLQLSRYNHKQIENQDP